MGSSSKAAASIPESSLLALVAGAEAAATGGDRLDMTDGRDVFLHTQRRRRRRQRESSEDVDNEDEDNDNDEGLFQRL